MLCITDSIIEGREEKEAGEQIDILQAYINCCKTGCTSTCFSREKAKKFKHA